MAQNFHLLNRLDWNRLQFWCATNSSKHTSLVPVRSRRSDFVDKVIPSKRHSFCASQCVKKKNWKQTYACLLVEPCSVVSRQIIQAHSKFSIRSTMAQAYRTARVQFALFMVVLGVTHANQIKDCNSSGTSTCMDNYAYVGPTGLDCADWYHKGCNKAASDASFSSSDVAKLWSSCPQSCKTCSSCADNPSFSDIYGYTCENWAKYNCSKAVSKYGYTTIQQRLVIQNCRSSCNLCDDIRDTACAFPFYYNGAQYSTCINRGSSVLTECRTHSGDWKVCIPEGTPCVIPFKYDGIKYTGCTVHGTNGKYAWCATKTDRNNYMVPGHWAPCQNCDLSQVLETQGCNGTDGFSVAGPTRKWDFRWLHTVGSCVKCDDFIWTSSTLL